MSRLSAFWRNHRIAALMVCALGGVVLVGALIWPFTDLIAAHDVGLVAGPQRAVQLQTAREAVRTELLTLGAGLFAFAALVYTARNYSLSRESQVTDRYTKAIDHLGSKELDVRIGGIYALERIARDSARDHPTVVRVLSAFVREHCYEPWPRLSDDESGASTPASTTRPDVEAAVNVIGRRNFRYDRERVFLGGTNLPCLILTDGWLAEVDLTSSSLTQAFLSGTNFTHAWLPNADLTRARLDGSDLTGAWVSRANLTNASLIEATLTGARLDSTILVGANLTRANLDGVDLTNADLTAALWPSNVMPPDGWEWDVGSDRLKRTGTNDSETA